jgi:NarL family two-component system response regulator LiaR
MTVRVLLVDDHRLFLEAVVSALAAADDGEHDVRFEVVGTATSGSAVLPLVNRFRPEMVLLDIGLPGMDGLTCLDLLRDRFPDVKVVIFSGLNEAEYMRTAFGRGAAGYILKTINPVDLVSALRQIVEGSAYLMLPRSEQDGAVVDHGLTEREVEILRRVARGLSNAAIGKDLFVTEQTVKFHLTNVFRKLGVNNRTAAAREAHRLGLASNPALDADLPMARSARGAPSELFRRS